SPSLYLQAGGPAETADLLSGRQQQTIPNESTAGGEASGCSSSAVSSGLGRDQQQQQQLGRRRHRQNLHRLQGVTVVPTVANMVEDERDPALKLKTTRVSVVQHQCF
ncbi:unnamed protein product, partial [Laminaria digitata]